MWRSLTDCNTTNHCRINNLWKMLTKLFANKINQHSDPKTRRRQRSFLIITVLDTFLFNQKTTKLLLIIFKRKESAKSLTKNGFEMVFLPFALHCYISPFQYSPEQQQTVVQITMRFPQPEDPSKWTVKIWRRNFNDCNRSGLIWLRADQLNSLRAFFN